MFDLGWPELMLIMVVALIVIGPKELPNTIRTVSAVMRKVRAAGREFQSGLDDIARESGLDDVKRQIDDLEYYDPKAALENIAESDKDLLGLDDDPDTENSILGPQSKTEATKAGETASNEAEPKASDTGSPHDDNAFVEAVAVEPEVEGKHEADNSADEPEKPADKAAT